MRAQIKYHLVSIITAVFAGVFLPRLCYAQSAKFILSYAHWISGTDKSLCTPDACPLFKKTFALHGKVAKAKLTITALGLYEASINGHRVGSAFLTPGWTSYSKRLQYQVYNITGLKQGPNTIQVMLNGGWYSGVFGGAMQAENYGKGKALLCTLEITFLDGRTQYICSDRSWIAGKGSVISGFYQGETIDHRVEKNCWAAIQQLDTIHPNLVPQIAPPVTRQEQFKPKRIFMTPKAEEVIDFGQNLGGFVRLSILGRPGDTVIIFHAEVLDSAGNFFTGNLREARATDTYILAGKGWETFEPHFTYHGFRYAKIECRREGRRVGLASKKWSGTAVALHSALKNTGTFSCSSPLINRLQHNIEWSLNSNFVDIPTDCPQRSERLGWTGDAQIFCRAAAWNRDVKTFYQKWLADLALEQDVNGSVPLFIPDIYGLKHPGPKYGVAGWGDAATIIPWTLYEMYGDKKILEAQYSSMKRWVEYIRSKSKENLWTARGFGDWYAPGDSTSLHLIDQCFWAHSTQLLMTAAKVLQRRDDVTAYTALLIQIKDAFNRNYIDSTGRAVTNTQTAYVLALQFDMLPENKRTAAAARLVQLIKKNDNHLATGFLGTPYLLPVLSRFGYYDVAYALLNQQTFPSWLYPVTKGATTIWEKWDAIKPDGTVQETSFNHYAYGAVGQWFYETIAGIQSATPAFRLIRIAPQPGGGLKWAKASYVCPFGLISSEWHIKGKSIVYNIIIPPHATARIELPGQAVKRVGPGHYQYNLINKVNLNKI